MGFASNHWVYERLCTCLFARSDFIVGGISAKPLAQELGTSIVPIRESLIRMAAQDIIEWIPSKGFFLGELRGNYTESLFHCLVLILEEGSCLKKKSEHDLKKMCSSCPLLWCHFFVQDKEKLQKPDQLSNLFSFDRIISSLIRECFSPAKASLFQYVWGHSIRFRYFLYYNFEFYTESLERSSYSTLKKRLIDIAKRYKSLAEQLSEHATRKQISSPYL